jgi:hypothetical protein
MSPLVGLQAQPTGRILEQAGQAPARVKSLGHAHAPCTQTAGAYPTSVLHITQPNALEVGHHCASDEASG